MQLWIPPEVQQQIIDHCVRQYPKEACGILAGPAETLGPGGPRVVQIYPMTNVENSPIGYSLDPKEQLKVEKEMRQRGQKMVGVYHSHTASAAYPSSVDVSLAISPDLSYVLVSLKDKAKPDVASYRIDGQNIAREEVVYYEATPGGFIKRVGSSG